MGGGLGVLQTAVAAAQHLHQLLVHHIDDLLHGGETGEHVGPQGPLLHPLYEFADDLEVYVRFQQGQAHLTQGLI